MSLTVPLRRRTHAVPQQAGPPPDEVRPAPPAPVRVGRVTYGSATAYLLLWAVVLFAVQVLAFVGAHAALGRLGVLDTLTQALDPVVAGEVPTTGVMPALELSTLLPWVLVVAAATAVLGLVVALALVLVHNAVCRVTGGLRVHVR